MALQRVLFISYGMARGEHELIIKYWSSQHMDYIQMSCVHFVHIYYSVCNMD